MTADEFIATIADFEELPITIQSDLLAHYLLTQGGAASVNASAVSSIREALHLVEHTSLAQYLSNQSKKKGSKVVKYVKTKDGYVLERGFAKQVENTYLGRPAAKNISKTLRGTLTATRDPVIKSYLEEAISCFEHNLLRSSVIMTWCVAYGLFRSWIFRNHLASLNSAIGTWKVPVKISKLDDFQDLTEATLLDTARKIGVVTKEQHKTLKQLLDQRNSFAHPTAKPITPSFAEAYIETVLREIIPSFG